MNDRQSEDDKDKRTRRKDEDMEKFVERLNILLADFKNELTKTKFWIEIIGLLGLFFYASIALVQWCAMQESNKLLHQQLEGTMRAIVRLGIGAELDQGVVEFGVTNEGHVAATDIHMELQVTKLSLPDLNPVGQPIEIRHVIPILEAMQQNPERHHVPFPVTQDERKAIDDSFDMVIETRGMLTYDDGFGIWREPICRIRYAFRVMKDGQPPVAGFASDEHGTPCEEFKSVLPSLLGTKRQAAQQQH